MLTLATWILALCTSAPLATGSPEGEGRPTSRALQQVVAALRSQRDPAAPPPGELAAGLERAARGLRSELLAMLHQRRVPALAEEDEPQVLSEPQQELVLELLGQPPHSTTRRALDTFLEANPGPESGRVACLTLGRVGRARELDALLAHAERAFGPEPRRPEELLVEAAVAELIRREPETIEYLVQGREAFADAWLPALLDAVGQCEDPRALRFVLGCLGTMPGLEVHCLAVVRKLGPTGDAVRDAEARAEVRGYLDPYEPGACRAACLAAAALEDVEAVAPMIELLAEKEFGLASDAHRALNELARVSMPPVVATWRRWHAEEEAWRAERQGSELDALGDPDPGRAAQAAAELARHPLYRGDATPVLARLLGSPDPVRRELACVAAGQLGLASLRPALEALREDADEGVRRAAAAALKRLL